MRRKNIINIIITLILSFVLCIDAYGNEVSAEYNLHNMNDKEIRNLISEIISLSTNNDEDKTLSEYQKYFTEDCILDFAEYVNNYTLPGTPISIVIDTIDNQHSKTNDTVLMINIEISVTNTQYNELYLYEFHINSEGKIYGYNVWVY